MEALKEIKQYVPVWGIFAIVLIIAVAVWAFTRTNIPL